MMIPVVFKDGEKTAVLSTELDGLIEKGLIRKFFRTDGWVIIGQGRIRSNQQPIICIPERRAELPPHYLKEMGQLSV